MLDRGATTIWESWEGADEHGVPSGPDGLGSLNHYSKGAVVSFLHRYVAGIKLLDDDPGYRRFEIAPTPGGGLEAATAWHESPYGRIESSWRRKGRSYHLSVAVPAGTTAAVVLPDGSRSVAEPGHHLYDWQQ
jgi:alpha-L-rhamnosidase